MLQDFLANRSAISASTASEAEPRSSGFQPLFAARAAALTAARQPVEIESDTERLEAPEIELVHEAGQVRRIIVTCKCCEKITIDCEY